MEFFDSYQSASYNYLHDSQKIIELQSSLLFSAFRLITVVFLYILIISVVSLVLNAYPVETALKKASVSVCFASLQ